MNLLPETRNRDQHENCVNATIFGQAGQCMQSMLLLSNLLWLAYLLP